MNCKPGDLAVVVRSYHGSGNEGRIVRCIRLINGRFCNLGRTKFWVEPAWETEPQLRNSEGNVGTPADEQLRPIRPDGITTEEVTQLYSPSPVKEVA